MSPLLHPLIADMPHAHKRHKSEDIFTYSKKYKTQPMHWTDFHIIAQRQLCLNVFCSGKYTNTDVDVCMDLSRAGTFSLHYVCVMCSGLPVAPAVVFTSLVLL